MKGLLHAIVAGLLSGLFGPICFISSFLSGGIAIGSYLQYSVDHMLSNKEVLYIGLACGLTSGLSAIIFWYGIILRLEHAFVSVFSLQRIQLIQEEVSENLWLYAALHLILSPVLSVGGAFVSSFLYQGD